MLCSFGFFSRESDLSLSSASLFHDMKIALFLVVRLWMNLLNVHVHFLNLSSFSQLVAMTKADAAAFVREIGGEDGDGVPAWVGVLCELRGYCCTGGIRT